MDDFREQIDCVHITEDGRCLLHSEPDYIDYCVLGPCSGYAPRQNKNFPLELQGLSGSSEN